LEDKWDDFGPLDLGVATLVVDTTTDYEPSLDDVQSWVWANTSLPETSDRGSDH
jgi:hypothetical protein